MLTYFFTHIKKNKINAFFRVKYLQYSFTSFSKLHILKLYLLSPFFSFHISRLYQYE